MGLWFVFLLGIGNFAAHRAVLESRHPLLAEIPWFFGRFSLAVEFAMLLGAIAFTNREPGGGTAVSARLPVREAAREAHGQAGRGFP